jgi:hypothetical protein
LAQPAPLRQDRLAEPTPLGFGRALTPDPVDAAIERHRAAREGLEHATKGIDTAMHASKQVVAEADAVFDAASAVDGAAWADLIATRPGDVSGAVRLLRYVSDSPASEVVEDPQDLLRQLAAVVEAAEAGGGRDGLSAGPHPMSGTAANLDRTVAALDGLAGMVEPDPALAVVAEFRASWDALGAAIEDAGGVGVPEVDPAIEDREGEAYERLKTVRPTTPEGFRALAGAWAMILGGERGGEPGQQHADHAADSLIAGAGVCMPGETTVPTGRRANTIAGGLPHADGTMTYCDAAGEPHRTSVAHWIGFVAFQLHCRAQIEMTRRRELYGDLPGAEIDRLEAQSRRELRLDALSDFAFRPDRVFLAAEALRTGIGTGIGTSAAGVDHVHALIAEHRAAFVEWDRASGTWNEMVPSDAGYAEAQAASTGPGKREAAAFEALFSAQPTTLAGTSALAAYLVEVVRRTCIDPDPSDGERALGTLAAALYGIAPGGPFSGDAAGIVSSAPADAALIALGAEFMVAWVEEARAGTSEAYSAVSAVAARIAVTPAETVAGYGIKALLVARLFGEGSSPLEPEPVPPCGPVYSVWRMLRQVQEGAARLTGARVEEDAPASLVDRILSTWAACAASEAASDDAVSERLLERRSALINEAERLPADRQHLVAKALALAWIDYADHHEERLTRADHAVDGRLALDIHAIARVPADADALAACEA